MVIGNIISLILLSMSIKLFFQISSIQQSTSKIIQCIHMKNSTDMIKLCNNQN